VCKLQRHTTVKATRKIEAVTEPGDVVWEPFGGLCSASVAAVALGRRAFAAETDPAFADLAAGRLGRAGAGVGITGRIGVLARAAGAAYR
jgi:DNA modification methylase